MIVITIARKPLSEGSIATNVLKHGTGGLNIDRCRIASGQDHADKCSSVVGLGSNRNGNCYGEWAGERVNSFSPIGRWPANLILEHLPGCRCIGVKKVKGISGGKTSGDNAFGQDTGWNAHENRPTGITRSLDAEGQETIAAWECQQGCPVEELDEQSGISISSGGRVANISVTSQIYGGGKGLGQDLNPDAVRGDPGFGDKGGASRFFKQVGGSKSLPTTLATITFHEEEAEDARKSLDGSGVVCTARWGPELDKYGKGEVLATPWGHAVCIFAIDRRQGWENHPHKELLTPRLKYGIGDDPFDLLYLHIPVVESQTRGGK